MTRLAQLEAWLQGMGISWNVDLIQLVDNSRGCSGLALGVQAVADVPEGAHLCTIPKAACISMRTSSIADILETESLGGGLGLILALLHEMSLGKESKWHGYLESLPAREYVPVFWCKEELELLEGTEAEGRAEADKDAMPEDFETHVLPLLERYPGQLVKDYITLGNFQVAASFVASRAFGIDDCHGEAMVPLADIFNHKASVVQLAPGYEVHGAGEDDSSDESSDDSHDDSSDMAEAEASDDEGTLCDGHVNGSTGAAATGCSDDHSSDAPAAGIMSAAGPSSSQHGIYGITQANGLHLRLEIGILDKEDHLEIVAASAVPKGREVHNTYGEHGNCELLFKYGFALRENPFTAVSLDKEELLTAAKSLLGVRAFKGRRRFLEAETEILDPEEEPFEVLPNGHVSPGLFVALRVLGADEAEFKRWSDIADALVSPPPAPSDDIAAPAAAAGAAAGGVRKRRREIEVQEEIEGQLQEDEKESEADLSVPPVQVWAVRPAAAAAAAGGVMEPIVAEQPLQPEQHGEPGAAAEPAAIANGAAVPAGDRRSEGAQQGGDRAAGLGALLTPVACSMLERAVAARLGRYPGSLEEDEQRWEVQQAQQQQAQQCQENEGKPPGQQWQALSEHESAALGALLLRLSEREVLLEMQDALQQRQRQQAQHAKQAMQTAALAVEPEPAKGRPKGSSKAGSGAAKRSRQQQQQEALQKDEGEQAKRSKAAVRQKKGRSS
ncbi:hypothetical protein N2152v2_001497 [Parachlorella kessleri]